MDIRRVHSKHIIAILISVVATKGFFSIVWIRRLFTINRNYTNVEKIAKLCSQCVSYMGQWQYLHVTYNRLTFLKILTLQVRIQTQCFGRIKTFVSMKLDLILRDPFVRTQRRQRLEYKCRSQSYHFETQTLHKRNKIVILKSFSHSFRNNLRGHKQRQNLKTETSNKAAQSTILLHNLYCRSNTLK